MLRRKFAGALVAGLLGVAVSLQPVAAAGPQMSAKPPSTAPAAPEKRSGVLQLAGGAYAYLPKGLTGAPAPLLVALHGAGGEAADVLEAFRADADRDGFVLLIPQSKTGTWDMIEDLKRRLGAEFNVEPRYGKDLKALDESLNDAFAKIAIDPSRVGVMGFSDGATYALSIGTANPQLFRTVIAFSPGPAFLGKLDPTQRIFISHGDDDMVLPYSSTRGIVSRLRVKKAAVTFESFKGGHQVPKDIHAKGIAFFKG